MTKYRTVIEKYLPPWAPLKPRFARVGDYVLYRYGGREARLALVEDASRDRKKLFIRLWIDSRQVWAPRSRWIPRTDTIAVVGKAPQNPTTLPEGQEGP